ncbi:alpha-amylase family glycosyl hydrolase [Fodinicola feengrottensis]|nr:alpha-amylase family glycosyl hydrolase [Fodinicola feengrottensis]
MQLFQWPWNDVGKECTNFLGPKGVWAVQVTPPQEHARVAGDPWWEVYQPVSYRLDSRSGNRAQFAAMVSTCKAAGVTVIVDVVLNHMTGTDGTSIDGTAYTKYHYPFYGPQDFHQPTCQVTNYQDRSNVQNCELVELADLNTGSDYVRQTEGAYLNDLLSLGVGGFRVDAAKHMAATDLAAIIGRVDSKYHPYIYQEVIDYGGEAISRDEYTGIGNVTEFRYGQDITGVFRSGRLSTLMHPEQSWNNWGLLGSSDAVPFVDDHDTERDGSALNYKDGSLYNLAQVLTLAWPYGNPLITSDFNWSNRDAGPPTASNGMTIGPYGRPRHQLSERLYEYPALGLRPPVGQHRQHVRLPGRHHWRLVGGQQMGQRQPADRLQPRFPRICGRQPRIRRPGPNPAHRPRRRHVLRRAFGRLQPDHPCVHRPYDFGRQRRNRAHHAFGNDSCRPLHDLKAVLTLTNVFSVI